MSFLTIIKTLLRPSNRSLAMAKLNQYEFLFYRMIYTIILCDFPSSKVHFTTSIIFSPNAS